MDCCVYTNDCKHEPQHYVPWTLRHSDVNSEFIEVLRVRDPVFTMASVVHVCAWGYTSLKAWSVTCDPTFTWDLWREVTVIGHLLRVMVIWVHPNTCKVNRAFLDEACRGQRADLVVPWRGPGRAGIVIQQLSVRGSTRRRHLVIDLTAGEVGGGLFISCGLPAETVGQHYRLDLTHRASPPGNCFCFTPAYLYV